MSGTFASVAWRMLPFVLGALYIGLVGTPWENTLTLAAENRLDLKAAFFYRYRDVSLLGGFGAATPAVSAIMTLIGIFGSRILFISICLATGALVLRSAFRLRLLMLLPVTAGLAFGEAFLLWSLLIALLSHGYARIRQRRAVTLSWRSHAIYAIAMVFALTFLGALISAFANPLHTLVRHKVLAGKSVVDRLQIHVPAAGITFEDSCAALVNPDDLRGVNAIELLSKSSVRAFSEIRLLDLKIVERNYGMLRLKNERGEFIFSQAARDFGQAEVQYAAAQQQFWQTAPQLCLVAVFDTAPEKEEAPFSRARLILDARKKAGLITRVIQLSAK